MDTKRISKKTINIVQNYTQRLSREDKLPINRVIIFGSKAKGNSHSHKWSDIDVCIVSSRFKDTIKALEFLWARRKREEVMAGLEPVGFSLEDFQKGSSLIREIKKTGVVIK